MMLALSLVWEQPHANAKGCSDQFVSLPLIRPAMERYFVKLRSVHWEGIMPFEAMLGKKIYLSRAFENLSRPQKKRILELLLLGYGEYTPLLRLLEPSELKKLPKNRGAMLPYEVYTSDGRILSYPYNACNRLSTFNEYERERLPFFGIKLLRTQRYPLRRSAQERVKRIFWESLGYEKARKYWIAWVPESGYFEIDVPTVHYEGVLNSFLSTAPGYYYTVVVQGARHKTFYKGKDIESNS